MSKIALVGMMASGKTTLGDILAQTLALPLVDIDEEIERQAGMSIPRIFKSRGEAEFRRLEQKVIARLLERPEPLIMPLGGGAYIQDSVRELLRNRAVSVYLRVRPDELVKRLEKTNTLLRPMLAESDDWREQTVRLAEQRDPVYMNADVIFPADSNDMDALGRWLACVVAGVCGSRLPGLRARLDVRASSPLCEKPCPGLLTEATNA